MKELINYEHLRELQHFARLGRMSASMLHEISNPLTAAMLNLELGDKQSSAIRRARKDMQIMRRYIEAARQQVRLQAKATGFRIQPQLDQLKRVVAPLARKAGVRLYIGLAPECQLHGDPVKFQHIISNLLVNAIEAYGGRNADSRRVNVVRMTFSYDQSWLTVQVADHGNGIAPEAMPRLFETFYTTKGQSGRGLGIGLAIVKQYVTDDFRGSIKVNSSPRRGTCFTVTLPLNRR
ncbi:MAG TPA: HAMP domain-containing sensor histidine kinase [Candidatus Dormibacteraeota bacterium]|nr:HAMP domain-containing sensor histidine kinase [Candidatus Dormibacteraeota bacterium]